MSPKRTSEGSAEPGGGPAFPEFLAKELKPTIESAYPLREAAMKTQAAYDEHGCLLGAVGSSSYATARTLGIVSLGIVCVCW
jgi:hypothetical protein